MACSLKRSNDGRRSHLTLRALFACIGFGLLLFACLPAPARAQTVASCQTTKSPALFPYIADNATQGWGPSLSPTAARASFAVGDIDGDGNDELITVPPVPQSNQLAMAQVSHWNQSGWTAMNSISNAQLMSNLPQGSAITISSLEVHLANVDGGTQKELVLEINWGSNSGQEQVYKYNAQTGIWTLLTAYSTGGISSKWMTVNTTSTQAVRVMVESSLTKLDAATWSGSQCTPTTYSPITLKQEKLASGCSHGMGLQGYCVAFGDVTGDGLTDLVYIGNDQNYNNYLIPSITGTPFGGTETFGGLQIHLPIVNQLENWQLADLTGNGVSELIIPSIATGVTAAGPSVSGALVALYWNTTGGYFAPVSDPYAEVDQTASALGPFAALEVVPTPIMVTNYDNQSGTNPMVVSARGIAALGTAGVYLLEFTNVGGVPTYPGVFYFSQVPLLTSAISVNNGFGPNAYSQYFKIAVEGKNLVIVARSANGIVNQMNGTIQNQAVTNGTITTGTLGVGSAFVDPGTLTDRGYPLYTASQVVAYEYISNAASGNPDLRSLYSDPAVPWPVVQYKVETLIASQAPGGVSGADFKAVQNQTIDEITAVQSVNQMYGVTGQILTNTYLVKDATLTEVTDLLNLSSDPDVTGQVINDVTSVLSGLGGLLSGVGSIVQLSSDADSIAKIVNNIYAASNVLSVVSTVTGDIATYTAGSPPDVATGSYSLKSYLDNSALAVASANTCHQFQSLSAWNQSKPIADGVLTGSSPLNLDVQQDILQASQALFQITVWQQLAPTKWDFYSVYEPNNPQSYFSGNSSYPSQAIADAIPPPNYCFSDAPGSMGSNVFGVALVLGDPATHNWPNINALQALFFTPPAGFGVNVSDLFSGKNGWAFSYSGYDHEFNSNTGVTTITCGPPYFTVSPDLVERRADSVGPRLKKLIADVKLNVTDLGLRDRLVMYLGVAGTRLNQARQYHNEPTEALRLINMAIAESQWHAGQDFRDSEGSRTESMEAVAIRDSLIESMRLATGR